MNGFECSDTARVRLWG